MSELVAIDKPTYAVPSMDEIRSIPWNGYSVASTFSGCGGSCLGYRMAGFRVLWANEFDPDARMSYTPNHPNSTLDPRSICDVTPDDVLAACGLSAGELDLFDGSPPCQTFSTAGKRNMQDKRTDLFAEYARLVKGIQPKVFVAENVSGMVKGVAKGQFKITLRALKDCGYRVECRLLDAQWLGVPQQRQRVIFIGVRNDLGLDPVFPKPLAYRYSVRDALPWIGKMKLASVIYEGMCVDGERRWLTENDPCRTLPTGPVQAELNNERRKFTIDELKRIGAFPDDFELVGSYAKQWARVGNSVPPVMMRHIATSIQDGVLTHCVTSPAAVLPATDGPTAPAVDV